MKPATLGFGVGLRRAHWPVAFEPGALPGVDFFELLTENHLDPGAGRRAAAQAAALRPVVLHGTTLDIGGVDPLDRAYLDALRDLAEATGARWISDHLCFSGGQGQRSLDLLPMPLTLEALDHLSRRIEAVQRHLAPWPFALENPSVYLRHPHAELSEAELLCRLVDRTGLYLLLDVNNVYVNSCNHDENSEEFIDAVPAGAVLQVHLAGHAQVGPLIIDTHGAPMIPEVVGLYQRLLRRTGPVSTLFEWDNDLPALPALVAECHRARAAAEAALGPLSAPWP